MKFVFGLLLITSTPAVQASVCDRTKEWVAILEHKVGLKCDKIMPKHLEGITGIRAENEELSKLGPKDFAGLINLVTLDLSRNNLKYLPADLLIESTKLEVVNLSANRISEIPNGFFAAAPQLTSLKLANNEITAVKRTWFGEMSALNEIDLSGNKLSSLETRSFTGAVKLSGINLSRNLIVDLPDDFFLSMPVLSKVNLANNRLKKLKRSWFAGRSILELDFSQNQISEIDAYPFRGSTLRTLNFAGNQLTNISSDLLSGARIGALELDLSGNRLSSLPRQLVRNIGAIGSKRCGDWGKDCHVSTAVSVSLKNNRIEAFDMESILVGPTPGAATTQTIRLDLSGNQLITIPSWFGEFKNDPDMTYVFKKLDLSNNVIRQVNADTFVEKDTLQVWQLNLSGNRIEKIDPGSLIGMRINISKNNLSSLPEFSVNYKQGSDDPEKFCLDLSENKLGRFPSAIFVRDNDYTGLVNVTGTGIPTEMRDELESHHKLKFIFDYEGNKSPCDLDNM